MKVCCTRAWCTAPPLKQTHVNTHTHTYIHACMHAYIHMHTYTCIHTYIHSYISVTNTQWSHKHSDNHV